MVHGTKAISGKRGLAPRTAPAFLLPEMSGLRLFFLLAAMVCATAPRASAELLDELDAADRAKVLAGRQVLLQEKVEGKPWPRVRVYQLVRATPEEVAAVFFDYDNSKTFVPDLLYSKISKRISPCEMEVDYEVEVPILADEAYTARNDLETVDGGGYRVTWNLVRAKQTKDASGHLRIEPHGAGEAVICYTNLVTPSSGMAKILEKIAIMRMEKTVEAMVRQVQNQKAHHPKDLARQVEALRAALAFESAGSADQ
jgi:hypothetical protein